jgi:hypothetical protein
MSTNINIFLPIHRISDILLTIYWSGIMNWNIETYSLQKQGEKQ